MIQSDFEIEFLTRWKQVVPHLPEPTAEYPFIAPIRRWRFDYAWVDQKVAVELQGGVWTQGRHSRGAGQVSDYQKHNTATQLGWRVLYFTPSMFRRDPIGCINQIVALIDPVPVISDAEIKELK